MTTHDFAYWTCPKCGETVESETIVDPGFLARVNEHKASHSVVLAVADLDTVREALATLWSLLDEVCQDSLETPLARLRGIEHDGEITNLFVRLIEVYDVLALALLDGSSGKGEA
jgi:hypothetical protein